MDSSDQLIDRVITYETVPDLISQILIFFKKQLAGKIKKIDINFVPVMFVSKFIDDISFSYLTCP